jgi:hypothetical protein
MNIIALSAPGISICVALTITAVLSLCLNPYLGWPLGFTLGIVAALQINYVRNPHLFAILSPPTHSHYHPNSKRTDYYDGTVSRMTLGRAQISLA